MVNLKFKEALKDITKYLKDTQKKGKERSHNPSNKSTEICRPWEEKFEQIRAKSNMRARSNMNQRSKPRRSSNYIISNFDKFILSDVTFDEKEWRAKRKQSKSPLKILNVNKECKHITRLEKLDKQKAKFKKVMNKRNDENLNKLLSHVLTPASPVNPVIMSDSRQEISSSHIKPVQKYINHPFKTRYNSRRRRRNLLNHSHLSVANVHLRENFEKIMQNQQKFEDYLKNSENRIRKPFRRQYKIVDIDQKIPLKKIICNREDSVLKLNQDR
ncbi:unnamed protein product [Moneuplotes crassus]|uniref:Uncharacterized protein n=1 Tax=Euplotes crassus TaxID=5936 RepID=A0AAD1UDN3_EUPCR|nr:unnamed protein product [Moneuplotes crassus]